MNVMKLKAFALLLTITPFMNPVMAELLSFKSPSQQATLLELYTSEGCSSCPPAEHWVNQLVEDEDLWQHIVPVVFHVDYWDYIGWKDRYASPEHSKRQRQYYKERGVNTVYTPGMLQNGKEWRGWWRSKPVPQSDIQAGILSANLNGQTLKAKFESTLTSSLKLHVAVLGFGLQTQVKAGENEGRVLDHEFVVLGQTQAQSDTGHWTVQLPDIKSHNPQRKAIAIWVSTIDKQRPIQAAGAWLN